MPGLVVIIGSHARTCDLAWMSICNGARGFYRKNPVMPLVGLKYWCHRHARRARNVRRLIGRTAFHAITVFSSRDFQPAFCGHRHRKCKNNGGVRKDQYENPRHHSRMT
jgi:hypothetical protein